MPFLAKQCICDAIFSKVVYVKCNGSGVYAIYTTCTSIG